MKTVHKSKRADIWEQNEQFYRGIIELSNKPAFARVHRLERLLGCYPTGTVFKGGQDYQFKYGLQLHEQVMAIICS